MKGQVHSFLVGDVVRVTKAGTKDVVKEGPIVATGGSWILVGAARYNLVERGVWTNRDLGRCKVQIVKQAAAMNPQVA